MIAHRLCIALSCLLFKLATSETDSSEFAVVGYLPEWRYSGANYHTLCQHLTHLLLFSLEPTPSGGITALDRLPSNMAEILAACDGKTKVMICFGGNGRSNGFSQMTQNPKSRQTFVSNVVALCQKYGLDGVDYNWEYPGYTFGRGYQNPDQVDADYKGLASLVQETRTAFAKTNSLKNAVITLAYYPDTRQERLLLQYGIANHVDLMHSMSYDQGGKHHSTAAFGKKTADQALEAGMPPGKVTMGLPFYGRYSGSGDWVTYEDMVQNYHPLDSRLDEVLDPERGPLGFNGKDTIQEKVLYAKKVGLGGVMIWEAGQDCRVQAVVRDGTKHVVTCPEGGESSLLVTITSTAHGQNPHDKGEL